jgi:class 3 adenylate cyclase
MVRSIRPAQLAFVLIALAIGYATEWVPYYVGALFGGELQVLGAISNYSVPCSDPPRGPHVCRAAYRLPAELLHKLPSPVSLGAGIILFETEAQCLVTGAKTPMLTPSDKSGQSTDAPNTYQTLYDPTQFCAGDLLIKAWAHPSYRRAGHVEAPMVIGTPERVREVKVLIEFFRSGLMHILVAVFLVIVAFDTRFVKIANRERCESMLDRYAWGWIANLFLISGLVNTLFPMGLGPLVGNQALHLVGWIVLPGTLLHRALAGRPEAPRILPWLLKPLPWFPVSPLALAAFAQVLIPGYNPRLAPMEVAVTLAGLAASLALRDGFLFLLALCGFLDALKDYMVPYMPYYTTLSFFFLFCFAETFVARLRTGAQVVHSLKWAQREIDAFNGGGTLPGLLVSFARQFGARGIALEQWDRDGHYTLEWFSAGETWAPRTQELRGEPALLFGGDAFARVVHPSVDSRALAELGDFGRTISAHAPVSVIPIEQNGTLLARLIVAEAPPSRPDLADPETARLRINTCLDMLLPFLARTLSQRKAALALAEFLPAGVSERLLEGKSVRVTETGYLLMVDIRDSTRIARRFGNDFWARFMRALSKDLEPLAREHGFALQLVVWDALYLTLPGEPSDTALATAEKFARKLHAAIRRATREVFGDQAVSAARGPCARFCLTYGDTTRDVRSVHKADWTIVGKTLAAVCKLEQSCKPEPGWLFADGSAIAAKQPAWEPLAGTVQATGEGIFRFRAPLQAEEVTTLPLPEISALSAA